RPLGRLQRRAVPADIDEMRSAFGGTVVMGFAFFDGVLIGAPIAVLAASFRPVPVYCGAVLAVVLLVIACCRWLDRRWEDWLTGKGRRLETRLERMRASRLMSHPVEWLQRGSDRWYAFGAAGAHPILVDRFARPARRQPVAR